MSGTPERSDLLTDREKRVVRLIEAGFTRWRIAELEGVAEVDTLRDVIRGLCERYDCRMHELPDAAENDL
jgi:DNA-binding NarL/FixJ family response regulator